MSRPASGQAGSERAQSPFSHVGGRSKRASHALELPPDVGAEGLALTFGTTGSTRLEDTLPIPISPAEQVTMSVKQSRQRRLSGSSTLSTTGLTEKDDLGSTTGSICDVVDGRVGFENASEFSETEKRRRRKSVDREVEHEIEELTCMTQPPPSINLGRPSPETTGSLTPFFSSAALQRQSHYQKNVVPRTATAKIRLGSKTTPRHWVHYKLGRSKDFSKSANPSAERPPRCGMSPHMQPNVKVTLKDDTPPTPSYIQHHLTPLKKHSPLAHLDIEHLKRMSERVDEEVLRESVVQSMTRAPPHLQISVDSFNNSRTGSLAHQKSSESFSSLGSKTHTKHHHHHKHKVTVSGIFHTTKYSACQLGEDGYGAPAGLASDVDALKSGRHSFMGDAPRRTKKMTIQRPKTSLERTHNELRSLRSQSPDLFVNPATAKMRLTAATPGPGGEGFGQIIKYPLFGKEVLGRERAIDSSHDNLPYSIAQAGGGMLVRKSGGMSSGRLDRFSRCFTIRQKSQLELEVEAVETKGLHPPYKNPTSVNLVDGTGLHAPLANVSKREGSQQALDRLKLIKQFKGTAPPDEKSTQSVGSEGRARAPRHVDPELLADPWVGHPNLYPSELTSVHQRYAYRETLSSHDLRLAKKDDFWLPKAKITATLPGTQVALGSQAPMRELKGEYAAPDGVLVVEQRLSFRAEVPGM